MTDQLTGHSLPSFLFFSSSAKYKAGRQAPCLVQYSIYFPGPVVEYTGLDLLCLDESCVGYLRVQYSTGTCTVLHRTSRQVPALPVYTSRHTVRRTCTYIPFLFVFLFLCCTCIIAIYIVRCTDSLTTACMPHATRACIGYCICIGDTYCTCMYSKGLIYLYIIPVLLLLRTSTPFINRVCIVAPIALCSSPRRYIPPHHAVDHLQNMKKIMMTIRM